MPNSSENAGLDLKEYHDTAKELADRCRVAKNNWDDAKRVAAAKKADFDDLMELLMVHAGEEKAPETPLLDGGEAES